MKRPIPSTIQPHIGDVPIYSEAGTLVAWFPRNEISWYNYNLSQSDMIYRVGEISYHGTKGYVFDCLGDQWIEFSPTSSIML